MAESEGHHPDISFGWGYCEVLFYTHKIKGLHEIDFNFATEAACCVVMCSGGYPGSYEKGRVITGLEDVASDSDLVVFHAGTVKGEDGSIQTAGGRVLGVTALGPDLATARDRAYAACERISFDGANWRKDIGHRVLSATSTRKT